MSRGDDIPCADHTLAVNTRSRTSEASEASEASKAFKAWLVALRPVIWFGSLVRQFNSFTACLSGEVGENPTLTRNRKSA